MRPKELIKLSKNEYDRLVEISPPIPQKIIDEFNNKINNETSENLRKPEVCDIIVPTSSYNLSQSERDEIKNMLTQNKEKPEIIETPIKDQRLEQFKKTFFELNNRYPTEEELNTVFFTIYNTKKSVSNSSVTEI